MLDQTLLSIITKQNNLHRFSDLSEGNLSDIGYRLFRHYLYWPASQPAITEGVKTVVTDCRMNL